MDKVYDIMLGDEPVGCAQVKREGLYYSFCCSCKLSGDVLCKIVVICGERTEDLGICVPKGNEFGLEKKVPVKRLGDGALHFIVAPKHGEIKGKFIPIHADEPFAYIGNLQKAHLEMRGTQIGAVLHDEQ